MAHLVRSAKSGNDWTLNDLDSYHISLNQMHALPFFGLQVTIKLPKSSQNTLTTLNVIGVAPTLG